VIYARLFGGLGNQLFQYAAGRALADHLGCDLALDRRSLNAAQSKALDHFADARHVSPGHLPPAKSDGLLRYVLWRAFGRHPRFHREKTLGFDPNFFELPGDTYLHGYWQSERYFAGIVDRLRADLTFTGPLDTANTAMAARIDAAACPVSLHVRRCALPARVLPSGHR
jgi:hypothetical protein